MNLDVLHIILPLVRTGGSAPCPRTMSIVKRKIADTVYRIIGHALIMDWAIRGIWKWSMGMSQRDYCIYV